ncbi:hypothetical protein MVEN_01956000 [Mycena venus]|uniref:Uncharacterized protein n=1 Tax=Mycena venus TaxID=2733690 RepID=A0A8H6XH36_9AGAR|nr:hypothetical protein MVEN_01956000 [Mycena venus]
MSKFTESKSRRPAALDPSTPRSQAASTSKSPRSTALFPSSPNSQAGSTSKSPRSTALFPASPNSQAGSTSKSESKTHRSKPSTSGRPRSLSSSTGTSAPNDWPPRVSSMTTPWTTPANSWPTMDLSPRDQCLRNSALFGKILSHIEPGTDLGSLKAQRQSLLWIALTCRTISPTAIKYLWRRLDNLLPLLYLLPSFTKRNSKYGLSGAPNPLEWQAFDRHATFVKEIVYEDIPKTVQIDPAVYLRLFLRNATILPHLERFACKTSVRPSESEILVYLQSPLHTLELGTFEPGTLYGGDTGKMAATREAVVSSLSTNPSHISHLILVDQPFSVLAEGIPLQHLTSLEFRAMYGVMDATLLRQIGSLPFLRSFTADSGCFTGLNLSNIATRLSGAGRVAGANASQSQEHGGLFTHLTHLELERHPSLPHSTISLFLQLIGSPGCARSS